MRRTIASSFVLLSAGFLVINAAQARTFDLDGKSFDPGKTINEYQSDGSLSKEQAAQFLDEEKKIADQEQKDKNKHKGQLTAGDQKDLSGRLDKLMKKVESVRKAKADNTARNVGDQRKDSLTPDKQSEKSADIKMLGSIRRKLMSDKSLSSNAKNVKVICNKGELTLRGPVDSADEKARVQADVAAVAGDAKVLNELDVLKK